MQRRFAALALTARKRAAPLPTDDPGTPSVPAPAGVSWDPRGRYSTFLPFAGQCGVSGPDLIALAAVGKSPT
ncbi:hypothetical protein NDU88_002632 [Pleurodeles waltl]|uniref:Uncharacterized protein n=1 Tax=Pleurodeles waltl TaxID=8319 RepID=A0AAV7TMD8_PLEWA|nr:hypothetical protein NDU88_002632 [Pleurodeles waltl]